MSCAACTPFIQKLPHKRFVNSTDDVFVVFLNIVLNVVRSNSNNLDKWPRGNSSELRLLASCCSSTLSCREHAFLPSFWSNGASITMRLSRAPLAYGPEVDILGPLCCWTKPPTAQRAGYLLYRRSKFDATAEAGPPTRPTRTFAESNRSNHSPPGPVHMDLHLKPALEHQRSVVFRAVRRGRCTHPAGRPGTI